MNQVVLIIEVKPLKANLLLHYNQLAKYFNALPSTKYAILTNGLSYHFFTDLMKPNKMDIQPFFICQVCELTDYSIWVLNHFVKVNFNIDDCLNLITYLQQVNQLISLVNTMLKNPSRKMIEFLMKYQNEIRLLQKPSIIEAFKIKYKKE